MSEAARLPVALNAWTNSDWNGDPFQFLLGGVAEDFTGASAKLGLRRVGTLVNAAELTSSDGSLTIATPNQIAITAPLSMVSPLVPGLYNWDLSVTYQSGDIETILVGQVLIIAGLA